MIWNEGFLDLLFFCLFKFIEYFYQNRTTDNKGLTNISLLLWLLQMSKSTKSIFIISI